MDLCYLHLGKRDNSELEGVVKGLLKLDVQERAGKNSKMCYYLQPVKLEAVNRRAHPSCSQLLLKKIYVCSSPGSLAQPRSDISLVEDAKKK